MYQDTWAYRHYGRQMMRVVAMDDPIELWLVKLIGELSVDFVKGVGKHQIQTLHKARQILFKCATQRINSHGGALRFLTVTIRH
jgi:hypothetical protein